MQNLAEGSGHAEPDRFCVSTRLWQVLQIMKLEVARGLPRVPEPPELARTSSCIAVYRSNAYDNTITKQFKHYFGLFYLTLFWLILFNFLTHVYL